MTHTLIATTIMGLESVLAKEIQALGYDTEIFNTKVAFKGDDQAICRANLWLRTAGRVYLKIASFKATTFDELFDQTRGVNWSEWIGQNDQFPVTQVSSRKSALFSKSDCQSIVKKAIVTHLQTTYKSNTLPETGASYPIRVQIESDIVTLSIDTTGDGLNKRGYRAHMSRAPLRETLAAGLVLLSRWRPDQDVLMDPFCGTGTILIEAGLIARNMAPGLNRSFNSEKWHRMSPDVWATARREATDCIKKESDYRIYGSDNNPKALSIANKNIELAGLTNIFVQKRELTEISSRFEQGKIIANPPYGERLETGPDLEIDQLYEQMGHIFREQFPLWSYYILTSHEAFDRVFGKKSTKNRKLYNGGIMCWYYQYFSALKHR